MIDDYLPSKESLCMCGRVSHEFWAQVLCYAAGRMTRHIPPPCSCCSNRGYDDIADDNDVPDNSSYLGSWAYIIIIAEYDILYMGGYVIEIVESRRTTLYSRSFGCPYFVIIQRVVVVVCVWFRSFGVK